MHTSIKKLSRKGRKEWLKKVRIIQKYSSNPFIKKIYENIENENIMEKIIRIIEKLQMPIIWFAAIYFSIHTLICIITH